MGRPSTAPGATAISMDGVWPDLGIRLSGLIKRLLIAVKAGQMAFDFHAVVQDTTHADHLWSHRAIEKEVARSPHQAVGRSGSATTVTQMIAAHREAEFRTGNAAGALRICRYVSQGSDQEGLVALSRDVSKALLGIDENINDIRFGCRRKAIDRHDYGPAARTRDPARRPRPATYSSSSSSCNSWYRP
jgi:hypothetical protein